MYNFGYTTLDGKIYQQGGGNSNGKTDRFQRYDPATNSWTQLTAPSNGATSTHSLIGMDGIVYRLGIEVSGVGITDLVQKYDVSAGTWSSGTSMLTKRRYIAVAVG